MKKVLISLGFIALAATAQVKIKDGTITGSSTIPNANSILDLESSNKGLHVPRVNLVATNNPSPLNETSFTTLDSGLVVYNLATSNPATVSAPYNVSPGLYYCDGTQWVRASSTNDWLIFGAPASANGTVAANGNPARYTDSQYVTGRVAIGTSTPATVANTASGSTAAQRTAYLTLAGGDASLNGVTAGLGGGQVATNTALGKQALYNNTTGSKNTVIGDSAAFRNTTGSMNTIIGYAAGAMNITGSMNTIIGDSALASATLLAGNENIVIGRNAMFGTSIPVGSYNVSIGDSSSWGLRARNYNVAIGHAALGSQGDRNITIGAYSGMNANQASNHNIAIGDSTFSSQRRGTAEHNIFIGYKAGPAFFLANYSIYIGDSIGYNDGGLGGNNILIGFGQDVDPTVGGDHSMNIGGAIFGSNMTGGNTANPYTGKSTGRSPAGNIGIAAVPNANYALNVGGNTNVNGNITATGTITPSDRRIKTDVESFTDGLNVITKLKPVTFHYNEKSGYSSAEQQKKHIGFIAQDVEKVAPYMVSEIDDSKGASGLSDKREIDMGALNQLLVNAVQEQQKEIEQLKKEIEALKK